MNYSKALQVEVLLYKNWAVLYTQRLQVQPIGILFSNLSGAIVGILGLFGSLMGIFEANYIKYKKKKSYQLGIVKLEENRRGLYHKNFVSNQEQMYQTRTKRGNEKPEQSSDDKSSQKNKLSKSSSELESVDFYNTSQKYKLPRSVSSMNPEDFDLVS